MTVDLLFGHAAITSPADALDLRFGALGGGPVDPPDPDPPLPDPSAGLLRAVCGARWTPAAGAPAARLAVVWGRAVGVASQYAARWAVARPVRSAAAMRWRAAHTVRRWQGARWAATVPVRRAALLRWRMALDVRGAVQQRWRRALGVARWVNAPWRPGAPGRGWHRGGWRRGAPWRTLGGGQFGRAAPAWAPVQATWQRAAGLLGWGSPWVPVDSAAPLPVPCYQADPGSAVLLLLREGAPSVPALLFACRRPALRLVPIRMVYMVINDVTLVRVADGAVVPASAFTLSLDADSWAWGFSAVLPPAALALVEPSALGAPVELEAWVNGEPVRVLVEGIQSDRVFGQHAIRLTGRGRSAQLDAPYALVSTFGQAATLTAQQILDGLLPVGWTADWGITPWLVPGGTWSHQGTPMTAAVAIASAAGAYVQPHDTDKIVRVRPRWPAAPWAWSAITPDVEIPAAVAVREGIAWVESPAWNGVYLSGTTTAGVSRLVKRAGTAADVLAPAIADQLITHDDAARPRGIHALAKGGRWADVSLRLPVLPETGIVRPGSYVRYVDGAVTRLGLSRGVQVAVEQGTVWQSIRLDVPIDLGSV